MKKFYEDTGLIFIGLVISLFAHASLFASFYMLKDIKKPKKEEKPIYISLIEKPSPKKETVQKRKIPKGEKKVIKQKKTQNPVKKKVVKKKTNSKKQKKKLVKKRIKKVKVVKKKIKKVKKKKVVQKKVIPVKKVSKPEKLIKKENKIKELKKERLIKEKVVNNKTTEEKENKPKIQNSFSLAGLKGKENIFQTGEKPKTEKKKLSEEDIWKYIKELERYLNNLARRKDLYPPMAKRLRLEGSLTVRFTIRKDGSVDESSIKVMVSSGYSILDKGAVKLIKKYVPLFARKEGKKPPRDNLTVELPITFEIIYW